MNVTYGEGWFRAKHRISEIWDESKAKMCHEKRELYVAVVAPGGGLPPTNFLEIGEKFVIVGFLDDKLREYMGYDFQEIEPGRLFMTMATHREYQGDSDKVRLATIYIFEPDGSVKITKTDCVLNSESEATGTTDVSGNWDSYPEFGKYESLIRKERGSL